MASLLARQGVEVVLIDRKRGDWWRPGCGW
jgi:hypothetical protein